jgi:hypothetical protein
MRKSIKGLTILFVIGIILVAATFVPSVNAAAYDRFRLVDSWVSGNTRTCLYENVRKEQKTKSISKGRTCPSAY